MLYCHQSNIGEGLSLCCTIIKVIGEGLSLCCTVTRVMLVRVGVCAALSPE